MALRNKNIEHWSKEPQLKQIEEWAKKGLSVHEIAKNMGIAQSTLYNWRDKDDGIMVALNKGQEHIVEVLENALIKRALGYDIKEYNYRYDDQGNEIVTSARSKHIYADVTALKFALINKSKGRWTDKVEYQDNSAHDKLDKMLAKMEENLDVD